MRPQAYETRREPILNLPGVVTVTIFAIVAIHAGRMLLLSPGADFQLLIDYAVVPARWTAAWSPSEIEAILREAGAGLPPREAEIRRALALYILGDGGTKPWTALTYAALHGSWSHVLMNAVWLAAFGTPVARRVGAPRFLLLGGLCAGAGALAHTLVHPLGVTPMIGASAAILGWMAAAATFVFPSEARFRFGGVAEAHERPRQGFAELLRNRTAAIFIGTWFVTNLVFGLLSEPLGVTESSVAWEAHVGGFLGGLLVFSWIDPGPA